MREMPYSMKATLRGELLLGEELTLREQDILAGAAKGETAAETGQRLYLATETVKMYRKRIHAKMGVKNITHAVAEGYKRGLLKLPRQ